ncbi:MAG: protein kinase [Planctomycetota bacterium]
MDDTGRQVTDTAMRGSCPLLDTLIAALEEPEHHADVLEHLNGCRSCQEALDGELLPDRFVAGLRAAYRSPGPEEVGPPGPASPRRSLGGSTPSLATRGEFEWIGDYRILRLLGEGGMGRVYLAEQAHPRRCVALKVFRASWESRSARLRFEREAEFLGRLEHPGIAQIYEAGVVESNGEMLAFIAMQFVEGVALSKCLSSLDEEEVERDRGWVMRVVGWGETLAMTLGAAHGAGIVHRDIKPQNVILSPEDTPVLLDFGVARDEEGGRDKLTLSGCTPGTPAYMSPEQLAGEALDRRSDIWSLGVLLFECMTLELPFKGATIGEIRAAVQNASLEFPRSLREPVFKDLRTVLATALDRDPDRRYSSAQALAADLRAFAAHRPISVRPPSAWYRAQRFARRNRVLVTTVAIAALLTMSMTLFYLVRLSSIATSAVASAKEARLRSYDARIASASHMIRDGFAREARAALDACPTEFRSWEWRYLNLEADVSAARFDDSSGWSATGLAVVQGGTRVLSGSTHGKLELWEPEHGSKLHEVRLPSHITAMTAPADGRFALVATHDYGLWVVDAQTRDQEAFPEGHDARISDITVTRDGHRAVSVSSDGVVKLWDVAARELIDTRKARGVSAVAVAIGPNGRRFALAGWSGVWLYDLATLAPTSRLDCPTGASDVDFSLDGRFVAASINSDSNPVARVWEAYTGRVLSDLEGHELGLRCVRFCPDSRRVVTGSWDETVQVWDAETGTCVKTLPGHQAAVEDLAFLADGRLVTSTGEKVSRVWNLDDPSGGVSAIPFSAPVIAFDISGESQLLAVLLQDSRDALVVDARTGDTVRVLRGGEAALVCIAISDDGERVFAGTEDELVLQWSTRGGEVITKTSVPGSPPVSIALAPNRSFAVVGMRSGAVWVVDEAGDLVRKLAYPREGWYRRASVCTDGARIAAGVQAGLTTVNPAFVWDAPTGELLDELGRFVAATSVAMGAGDKLAVMNGNANIYAWDLGDGRRTRLNDHRGAGGMVTYGPRGRYLLSCSRDKVAIVRDTSTGVGIKLWGHEAAVTCVRMTSDGDRVITSSLDGKIRIFESDLPTRRKMQRHSAKRGELRALVRDLFLECPDAAAVVDRLQLETSLTLPERQAATSVALSYDVIELAHDLDEAAWMTLRRPYPTREEIGHAVRQAELANKLDDTPTERYRFTRALGAFRLRRTRGVAEMWDLNNFTSQESILSPVTLLITQAIGSLEAGDERAFEGHLQEARNFARRN